MNFLYNIPNKFISFFKSSNNKNNQVQILNIKNNINPKPKPNFNKFKIILNKYFKYNLFYHWKNTYKNKNKKLLDYTTFTK
tara:strand:- start:926 stop:1168 length:243 start_codon:yes stop_codon:yes gene_type:complete